MDYEFHIQDPTSAGTIYLLEAILDASQGASSWRGIFAFASRAGVDLLIGDPQTQDFLSQSALSLLVGLDAVTTRQTPERLREDEDVLERAERNRIDGPHRRDAALRLNAQTRAEAERHIDSAAPVGRTDRLLIAQVPRAGDRWHQIHFNAEVIQQFFRVQPNSSQRVYLVECGQDGAFGEQEVRPCIYSEANKNHTIEVASHRGVPYPEHGSPIAVYRELQVRSFAYMLLMPGEPGHSEMLNLVQTLPNVGHGVLRAITGSARIRSAWPACPLISAIDALAEQD